jgi:DNA-directed RNA polymerase subunit RPC12/RpoP
MAPKNINLNVAGKTKSFSVYTKVTHLVPRIGEEEADVIIFGQENGGVVPVYIMSPKELNEENVALRIRWFFDTRPRCVKCGAAYSGKNHVKVVAYRNGTYYVDITCDKCDSRIQFTAAVIRGDFVVPKAR